MGMFAVILVCQGLCLCMDKDTLFKVISELFVGLFYLSAKKAVSL